MKKKNLPKAKRRAHKPRFHAVTIFPSLFDSWKSETLIARALKKKLFSLRVWNIRDFADGKHKRARPTGRSFGRVDDRPFGGGPGMVLAIEPIMKAVSRIKKSSRGKVRTILFSTRGKLFDAATARQLARYDELIFICGRYEGVDERVAEHIADHEISLGNFVLSGGELPAMVLMEAVSRFIPGVLGKEESLEEIKGSYPVYTRPPKFIPRKGSKSWSVPPVLLSGDHARIAAWRRTHERK